ncbi:MAG: hypothetical protein ACRCXS_05325 [Cetobacterium sp.]
MKKKYICLALITILLASCSSIEKSENKDIKIITTSSRDKKDDDLGNDDSVTYLINSSFSPIFRINLKEVPFFNFYPNNNLIYTILNRYENRVLRI